MIFYEELIINCRSKCRGKNNKQLIKEKGAGARWGGGGRGYLLCSFVGNDSKASEDTKMMKRR